MRRSRFGINFISSVGISLSILAALVMTGEALACYGACNDKDIIDYINLTDAERIEFCAGEECSGSFCGPNCRVANTRPTCKCKN